MTKKFIFGWLFVPALALMMGACGETDDEEESGGGETSSELIEVPARSQDVWVSAKDISDDDLTLLVDLTVKMEYMRVQFIKMLSNNFEGDGLFCGHGDKTNPDPTMETFTDLMVKADDYLAAMERLEEAGMLTPTTRASYMNNTKKIVQAGKKENERALEEIQDNLAKLSKSGKYDNRAQEELYDFYRQLEPEKAKAIGAENARDFFTRLNNGELNSYATNICHIWRDAGIINSDLRDDQKGSRVGAYADVAYTGHPEYLKSAYRVSSEVAVAVGEMYLTAVDKIAGGYGAKVIEWGDFVKDRLQLLEMGKKAVKGELDWQEVNSFIVNQYAGKIKESLKTVLGEEAEGLYKEFIDDTVETLVDNFTEQLVAESTAKVNPDTEEGKKKLDDMVNLSGRAVLDIFSDMSSWTEKPKVIIIIDDATGKVTMAQPNEQGRVTVPTFAGSKTITVLDGKGNRLTKKINAEEGYNAVNVRTKLNPYIVCSPSPISLKGEADYVTTTVITNCKYVKYRVVKQEPWFTVKIENVGSSGLSTRYLQLTVSAKANDTGQKRSGSVVVEGYDDNASGAKPTATFTLQFTQYTPLKGTISATPSTLSFEAEGGSQTVQLTIEDLEYYGGYVDATSEDWLSVTTGKNDQITITAKTNNTGEERTGIVYAYGTNVPNPSKEDIITTPIQVTQKAGSQQISQVEISSIAFKTRIKTNVTVYHHYWGTTEITGQLTSDAAGGFTESRFNAECISCSFSGSSLHADIDYENLGDHHIISFDVTDIKGDCKEARVTNLTWKRVYLPKSVFGYDNYNISVSYTNIPISKVRLKNASDLTTLSELVFDGKVADGMGISGYNCEQYSNDGWGGYHQSLFEYLNDGENFAYLEIDFKSVK